MVGAEWGWAVLTMALVVRPRRVQLSAPGGTEGRRYTGASQLFSRLFFFQPQSIEKPSKLEKRPGPGEAEKRKLQPPLYSMSR